MENTRFLWFSDSFFTCSCPRNPHCLRASQKYTRNRTMIFYNLSTCYSHWYNSLVFLWALGGIMGNIFGRIPHCQYRNFGFISNCRVTVPYFHRWWKFWHSWYFLETLITPHSHQYDYDSSDFYIFTSKFLFRLAIFWHKLALSLERRVVIGYFFKKSIFKASILCF